MPDEGINRKLAAILSADVKDYSRLLGQDEVFTIRTLKAHREAITSFAEQYKGRVIDTPGDSILAAFESVSNAVNCAVEIQRELAERNAEVPSGRMMEWRIGIELGDVVEEDGKVYGDGVNIAARIEKLTNAGGIGVSGTVHDKVKNKLGLEFESLGEKQVKNIPDPVHVYRVLSHPGAAAHRVIKAKGDATRKLRDLAWVTIAAAILFVGAVMVWNYARQAQTPLPGVTKPETPTAPTEKPSIAVLPFDNMSSDPEQEYFADAMTDEIISRLSKNSMLIVVARNSAFTYKGKAVKVQQVGIELGVKHILEGSVQRAEDKVKIIAQLVDASTGAHLWSETFERRFEDIFAVQAEISQSIAAALRVKYAEAEWARVKRIPTESMTAYDALWRGKYHFLRLTGEDQVKALKHLEKAIELDPNYADAYATLGNVYAHLFYFRWDTNPQVIEQAFNLTKKAISLDSTSLDAHNAQAIVLLFEGKCELALREAETVLSIDSNSSWGHNLKGLALACLGRYEESIGFYKKGIKLHPRAIFLHGNICMAYTAKGEYEEAETAGRECVLLAPDAYWSYWVLARAYVDQWHQQYGQDTQILDLALEMAGKSALLAERSFGSDILINAYLAKKQHDAAMAEAEKLLAKNPMDPLSYALLANILNYTGAYKDAIKMAEKAIQLDPNRMAEKMLKRDPGHHYAMRILSQTYRLLGRSADALKAYMEFLDQYPNHTNYYRTHISLAILYTELNRLDKARIHATKLLKLVPNFSVEVYGEREPYADPAQAERDMVALRKAGLK